MGHLAIGQNDPKDVIYKGLYNISFLVQAPIGNYKKSILSDFTNLSSTGLSFSYLGNPRKKAGDLSSILIGGEVGFVGNRQSSFFLPPPDGEFFMTHRQIWTNAKIRYLPNLAINKVLAYMEAGLGPRFFVSKMMENTGQDQLYKVYGYTSTTLNYTLETGFEYKISGNRRPFSYLNFGLGYGQANAVKVVNRNRVGFDNDYNVIDPKKSVLPQNINIKIGITSYL